jgi:hypothetical protein
VDVITHVVLVLPLSQDMAVYEMLAVPVAEAVAEDVDEALLAVEEAVAVEDDVREDELVLLDVVEVVAVEDDVAVAEPVGGIYPTVVVAVLVEIANAVPADTVEEGEEVLVMDPVPEEVEERVAM